MEDWKELPDASSLCGACREVCPVRLDIPRMLLQLRKAAVELGTAPWTLALGMRAFGFLASRPALYGLALRLGGIAARLAARDGWIRRLPGLAGGWTRSRDLRAPASRTFQQLWREREARKPAQSRALHPSGADPTREAGGGSGRV